ncbi:hypothetical protein DFH09DRAFT_1314580 [Mycena vulgaris]|nr:hypothetical protein DFH09DRAFT_1314580 [Mycena vulgaris]
MSNLEGPYHGTLKNVTEIAQAAEAFPGNVNTDVNPPDQEEGPTPLMEILLPSSLLPRTPRLISFKAYYQPNASCPNLTVLVSAHVSKLVLKQSTGMASTEKVRFQHEGEDYQVSVGKAVVLCTGTIMSPQILELLGIGDPSILSKAGIDVTVELPGVRDQEHVNRGDRPASRPSVLIVGCLIHSGATYETHEDKEEAYTTFDCLRDPAFAVEQLAQYQRDGTGVCGMGPTCMSFVSLAALSPDAESLTRELEDSIKA